MRIGIACPSFHIGGWSTHALGLSEAFRELGHQTVAIVPDPYGQLYDDFRRLFDRVVAIPRRLETRKQYLQRIARMVGKLRLDVLINNAVAWVQASYPLLPPNVVRLSVVHSIVDAEIQCTTFHLPFTQRVIAVSENVAHATLRYVPPAKLTQIPVGVTAQPLPRAARCPDGPIRLAYVGRVAHRAKNLPLLERVLDGLHAQSVSFTMTVVGDGDYLATMRRHVAARPWAERVVFRGALSPERVRGELRGFDAFLLTSTYEGTPHALLEAMAAGVVPVCSRIEGATDRIIESGVSGYLCNREQPNEFVTTIASLARHRELLEEIGERARARVVRDYGLNSVVQRYLGIIADCQCNPVDSFCPSPSQAGIFLSLPPAVRRACHSLPRHIRRRAGDFVRKHLHNTAPVRVRPEDLW